MARKRIGAGTPGGHWGTREAAESWRSQTAARAELLGTATDAMLDLAGVRPGDRVLDIAAGTGDQTLLAARRVGPTGAVLATDIAASMLDVAAAAARQEGLTNVTTRVLDAQRLDLAPASFDAVIARFGLMFLPDLHDALVGIRRVLRPGGKLAALVWSTPERNPAFARPVAIARRCAGWPPSAAEGPGVFALGRPGTLEAAYREADFREVTVRAIPLRFRSPSTAAYVRDRRESPGPLREVLDYLDEADQARIWAAIERDLRQFEGPAGFEAPGEALLGVGTRGIDS